MNRKNVGRRGYGLIGDNIPELPQGTTDNHAREDRIYSGQDESLETPEHERALPTVPKF